MSPAAFTLTFKSYEQGREAFQGTAQDVIVCDEEPPKDVPKHIHFGWFLVLRTSARLQDAAMASRAGRFASTG
jgi:hypothetical protein